METFDPGSILNVLNANPVVFGLLALTLLAIVVHVTVRWLSRRSRRR